MLSQVLKFRKQKSLQLENYQQWREQAILHDRRTGMDDWRATERTRLYDYQAIRTRLDTYRTLRKQGDDHGLLFALNEGIHGNMGGMGSNELYKRSRFGTKQLIQDYTDEVTAALNYLASPTVDSVCMEEKLEFFRRASHCFGSSALMLSGSGSLFYFHLGVVKALWEEDLLPSVISGASGGAIVAAIIAANSHAELENLFDPKVLKMEVEREKNFFQQAWPFGRSQMTSTMVEEFFQRIIPDITFQEAAALTGIHINVSVAPAEPHQTSRLLNDIASPNVMLREAVMASSAFPGFYPAVTLAAKDQNGERKPYLPSRKWIDGSVSDDLPIKRVMRLYGVNHTIVSQTNPVALPFINDAQSNSNWSILKQTFKNSSKEWALASAKLIDRPLKSSPVISRLLTFTSSVLSQTYTGDINILPPRRLHNPAHLLSDRTTDEIIELIKHGERATWPEIEKIRVQTQISRALNNIIRQLESDVLTHQAPLSANKKEA